MKKPRLKIVSIFLCILLAIQQTGFAQVATVELNIASHFASLHNALSPDKFRPLHLRSISYNSLNNNFKLLIDKGDQFKELSKGGSRGGFNLPYPSKASTVKQGVSLNGTSPDVESVTKDLLTYFFTGIALPNDTFWVNLRPDSPNNIIDPLLAQTEVGKILLEADLQLKKDTARATSPETPEGKEYWNKLYTKAAELYGIQNVTIPTLTRPWIVPDEIIIRESKTSAYVYKATLKVMLEQDYLSEARGQKTEDGRLMAEYRFDDPRAKLLNEYSSKLIRENIIPKLTKDINNAKRYAPLRQVYYSLILAQWFKARKAGDGSLKKRTVPLIPNLIDSRNLSNLQSKTPYSVNTYFNAYKENFAKGEYNIQEPVSTAYGQTIRSYFSGGASFTAMPSAIDKGIVPGAGEMLANPAVLAQIVGGLNPTTKEITVGLQGDGVREAQLNRFDPLEMDWDNYVGSIWNEILSYSSLSKDGVIVEIAPGDVPKIGLGLQAYGFKGTIYIIEPDLLALQNIVMQYKKLIPEAKIIPLQKKLREALSFLPEIPDMVLANHPLDDMILGNTLSSEEFQGVFDNHYNMPFEVTMRLWKNLENHPELLEQSKRQILDDWEFLIKKKRPHTIVISQYSSYFFQLHGMSSPDKHALELLESIAGLGKNLGFHVVRPQHRLIENPNSWLLISLAQLPNSGSVLDPLIPKGLTLQTHKTSVKIDDLIKDYPPAAAQGVVSKLLAERFGQENVGNILDFVLGPGSDISMVKEYLSDSEAVIDTEGRRVWRNVLSSVDGRQVVFYTKEMLRLYPRENPEREARLSKCAFDSGLGPDAMLIVDTPSKAPILFTLDIKGQELRKITSVDKKYLENIFEKIGISLGRLHHLGIVHDDLSTKLSRHVYVTSNNEIKFIDFGAAFESSFEGDFKVDCKNALLSLQALFSRAGFSFDEIEEIFSRGYEAGRRGDKTVTPDVEIRGRQAGSGDSAAAQGVEAATEIEMNVQAKKLLEEMELAQRRLTQLYEANSNRYLDELHKGKINDYVSRLAFLHYLGIVKGNLLYLSIGNDYFPAYFTPTFGINLKSGLGIHTDAESLEQAARKEGLPEAYWGRLIQLNLFNTNNFDTGSYFPQLHKAGGVDTLLIKGLSHWVSYYKSFPQAEGFILPLEGGKFDKQLESAIRDLIKKISKELIPEGGIIVIADYRDF